MQVLNNQKGLEALVDLTRRLKAQAEKFRNLIGRTNTHQTDRPTDQQEIGQILHISPRQKYHR